MVYAFSPFKFGHEAVIIFFVLSGFVIHLKQSDRNYNLDDFKILAYFKKRVIRIYPTLLISFVLCITLDYFIYLFIHPSFQDIFSKYNLSGFLFNLFLIPDAPIWGHNFPVWSLKHEWFFYLSYPLILLLSSRSYIAAILTITILYLSYLLGFRIPYVGPAAYTLTVWSLGCLLANLYKNNKFTKYVPYLLFLILIYPFLSKSDQYYPISDLVFGLVVMGGLSIIILYKRSLINSILTRFAWLGTFSYSIYLLHSPFLNFYQSVILKYEHTLPYHLWFVLLSIIITIPVIYLIYYFTERLAVSYKRKI